MADTTPNGQAPSPPSSWNSAVDDVRDMGLKYMNSALNAASGSNGGITRNQFNFPAGQAPSAPTVSSGLSGLAKVGIAAAAIAGTCGLAGLPFLISSFMNQTAPVAAQPDQSIGVKADLIVHPPGEIAP